MNWRYVLICSWRGHVRPMNGFTDGAYICGRCYRMFVYGRCVVCRKKIKQWLGLEKPRWCSEDHYYEYCNREGIAATPLDIPPMRKFDTGKGEQDDHAR